MIVFKVDYKQYISQGMLPDDVRDDKEIGGKGEILEKLLDLSALVDAMLLPTLTEANIAETLQEKQVCFKCI